MRLLVKYTQVKQKKDDNDNTKNPKKDRFSFTTEYGEKVYV